MALLTGVLLGIVCIIGASTRSSVALGTPYLLGFWYNRVLMGLLIGALPGEGALSRLLGRGALVGLIVSFGFYSATGFFDPMGFWVGALYGVIIEYAAWKVGDQ